MRYLTVPPDIELFHPVTRKPALDASGNRVVKSFGDVAIETWLNDPRGIAGGIVAQRRWLALSGVLENAKAGDLLPIEDQDWGLLSSIAANPSPEARPYTTLISLQLLPFAEAVLAARAEKP